MNFASAKKPGKYTVALALICVVTVALPFFLHDKLAVTEKKAANVLVLEGWLPPYAISRAVNEFKEGNYRIIVITGQKRTPEFFNVFTNGSLIFDLSGKNHISDTVPAHHDFEVRANSSMGGRNKAHFNFYVNDSLCGSFFADKAKRNFTVGWNGRLADVYSAGVRFLNDTVTRSGDRNLYVKELVIDHRFVYPYQKNSSYAFTMFHRDIRIRNDHSSDAELAKRNLLAMGLDTNSVVDIPDSETLLNRTLTSARTFRNWTDSTHIEIKGVNIVTLGSHARRTLMIYQKVLQNNKNVGVISVPDFRERHFVFRTFKTAREVLGIIYYWLILNPFA
jgi:hypothetical protein